MDKDNYIEQYEALKAKYTDVILLFRTGGFYLLYRYDVIDASRILGLDYSKVTDGDEIAGFPIGELDTYLPKLVRANRRVAILEPLDEEVSRRYKRMKKAEPQTV